MVRNTTPGSALIGDANTVAASMLFTLQEVSSMMGSFTPARIKARIAMSIIESLDIRVGTIQAVGDVSESRKLIKLTVGFGDHTRCILAGMKQERENAQELVGRQALFVVNLEPERMAGELSEGMILDVGYADALIPVLAIPERPVPDGARAG